MQVELLRRVINQAKYVLYLYKYNTFKLTVLLYLGLLLTKHLYFNILYFANILFIIGESWH